ncbi:MAG: hypothetical protein ACR2PL_03505 [Dehalococcoidia bacterium]
METYYVDLARTLPQVRQVLVDECSPSTAIWTVIEAEPFDESQCEPVYQAELEALIAHPDAEVDLHLVNLSEYPGTPAEQLLPTNAQARYTP